MKIRAYWHPGENFGDRLTPIIVSYITNREVVRRLDSPRLFCVGSIISNAKPGDVVWGAGVIVPEQLENIDKGVRFAMVRGPKTREILVKKGFDVPEFTADPAMLLCEIYKNFSVEKRYKEGLIPHVLAYESVRRDNLNAFVINLSKPIEEVIRDILSCERIYSESLHGLVCAEVFGIPVVLKTFWNHKFDFEWKFEDYYLSTDRKIVRSFEEWEKPRVDMEKIKSSFPWEVLPVEDEWIW
ncbi:MAG TPA: polysaccharide pyruvyl transferase family protein [Methanofastidiosum sp.]|nr:polysaccharide pyruvyl transferase family protein [Methanofastidiosum sp.]